MKSDRAFDLVIFDCDGVLVDSEMLSAGVLMSMMADDGFPITPEIFRSDFLGRSFAAAALRAAERFGRPLAEDFEPRYREKLFARMAEKLRPMEGVERVLSSLTAPFCLATSSTPKRLALSLRVTNLDRYFDGKCFTASQVKHGKPAPDLFLLSAETMKAEPRRCVVIEDSELGVRAGLAAGMETWHFAGGAHIKAGYRLPETVAAHGSVSGMDELLERFQKNGLC